MALVLSFSPRAVLWVAMSMIGFICSVAVATESNQWEFVEERFESCVVGNETAGSQIECVILCKATANCTGARFEPGSGNCTLLAKDGSDYCQSDKTEEETTPTPYSPTPYECSRDGEVPCTYSQMCIPENYFCDGYQDCPDGTDETNCSDREVELSIAATGSYVMYADGVYVGTGNSWPVADNYTISLHTRIVAFHAHAGGTECAAVASIGDEVDTGMRGWHCVNSTASPDDDTPGWSDKYLDDTAWPQALAGKWNDGSTFPYIYGVDKYARFIWTEGEPCSEYVVCRGGIHYNGFCRLKDAPMDESCVRVGGPATYTHFGEDVVRFGDTLTYLCGNSLLNTTCNWHSNHWEGPVGLPSLAFWTME